MSEKEKSSSASQSDGWEQTQAINIHCIDRNDKIPHFQEVVSSDELYRDSVYTSNVSQLNKRWILSKWVHLTAMPYTYITHTTVQTFGVGKIIYKTIRVIYEVFAWLNSFCFP